MKTTISAHHVVVYHDPTHWAAVPANNGANGPVWQWNDELLVFLWPMALRTWSIRGCISGATGNWSPSISGAPASGRRRILRRRCSKWRMADD